jgi:hypothetical protein
LKENANIEQALEYGVSTKNTVRKELGKWRL